VDLGDRLIEAMRGHLVSDVPILLFLSGGIDSACLGGLARRAGAENLTAMTVAFEEREFDESELSRRTASALEIPHRIVTLRSQQVSAELDHAVWAMDQPTMDGLNSYWISRLAAEAGFKVALSGQGGDEFFGGYESLAWFQRFTRIARVTGSLPKRPFSHVLDRPALPFRWRKLSYLFGCDDPFVASQLAVKVHFLSRDLQQLLGPSLANVNHKPEAEDHLVHWAGWVKGLDLKEAIAFMDIHTHLQPRLLRDMDAMSMAHSLEVRPVFLDHLLAEFLLSVPPSIRIQKKLLLLKATRRLLPEVLAQDLLLRKKRTFTFPFARWLQRDLCDTIEQTFSPSRLREVGVLDPRAVAGVWEHYKRSPAAVGWSRIWTLFVLQRWCEVMRVTP
jgi:asparagine synthase (glutamine-hydrolysing)